MFLASEQLVFQYDVSKDNFFKNIDSNINYKFDFTRLNKVPELFVGKLGSSKSAKVKEYVKKEQPAPVILSKSMRNRRYREAKNEDFVCFFCEYENDFGYLCIKRYLFE